MTCPNPTQFLGFVRKELGITKNNALSKIISASLITSLVFFNLAFAEDIKLKNGQPIKGTITQKTDKYIKTNFQGVELTYFADEIENFPVKASSPETKEKKLTRSYRITKRFRLKPSADLELLRFKSPLPRENIENQINSGLKTEPAYTNIETDSNNNRFAIFDFSKVKNGEDIEISMSYDAQILDPQITIDLSAMGDSYGALEGEPLGYLRGDGNIDVISEETRYTSRSLCRDIYNPYRKGKAIYNFIIKNIAYENVVGVSGMHSPEETLKLKKGNCVSIARLFIALARASGIPARQVTGLIFLPESSKTNYVGPINKAAHVWVEIYLPVYGWLPVDPTFRNPKENYYCFNYKIHIKEAYGEAVADSGGLLYSKNFIEVKSYEDFDKVPVDLDDEVEIELVDGQ